MPDLRMLVNRAKKGDLDAMETLFRLHETSAYTVALKICGRAEDAEDVLQETFLEIARSLRNYRGEGPLGAWIRKISATKALMKLRRRRRERWDEPLDEDSVPEGARIAGGGGGPDGGGAAHRIDLENALARLSDTARAVVWLHDVEGYTHEEIAGMVGRTPSFSKSQLARAHLRLREALRPKGGMEPCIRHLRSS